MLSWKAAYALLGGLILLCKAKPPRNATGDVGLDVGLVNGKLAYDTPAWTRELHDDVAFIDRDYVFYRPISEMTATEATEASAEMLRRYDQEGE